MSGVTGSHTNTDHVQNTGHPIEASGIRPIPRGASWEGLEDEREDEGEGERGKPSTAALPMGSGSWTGGATAALPLKPIGSPFRGAGCGKAVPRRLCSDVSGVAGSHANTARVQDTGHPLEESGIRPIPRGASWPGLEDAREDEGEGERGKPSTAHRPRSAASFMRGVGGEHRLAGSTSSRTTGDGR